MHLGFRKTAVQAVCVVLILCFLIGMARSGMEPIRSVFAETDSVRLPVLMYHSILKDSARQGKYVLHPDVLAADLDFLQAHGYRTITISDLLAYVMQDVALPAKPVMITFDDGYFNNYVYAYPLLKERGMRAVLSVIGAQTDLFTENGQENAYWSHLTISRLLEMQPVFEIQNHSWNLHEYGQRRGCLRMQGEDAMSYASMLLDDAEMTQHMLTDAGLPMPHCYTYPFGACSAESEEILRADGFLCTMGCEEKNNKITRDAKCLYELGRYNRPSGESSEAFMKRVLGE